jgi:CheY-like chemotaxis protein
MRERHGGTALLPPQAATVARRPAGLVQVVLADEAPLMHLAVRSVLAAMPGFTLAAAAAGLAEAEQLILRVHPDLLVTDADLAGESGIALCRWARQAYPGVVTVILTGVRLPAQELGAGDTDREPARRRARRAGAG